MNQNITLSYVLTTFNKLEYLQITLPLLIKSCKIDEEIIVTDGGSTDGTVEYLKRLLQGGKIHQLLSDRDKGESDGFNKGILLANGKLIKLLTDDDVFDFEGISTCKNFMLKNQNIDLLNTSGAGCNLDDFNGINSFTEIYESFYEKYWLTNNQPFAHCCLGIMLRKTSVEKIGLLSIDYRRADAEYSLRYTSKKINFVWYKGLTYVRLLNQKSNSTVFDKQIQEETTELSLKYGFDIDRVYDHLVNKNIPDEFPVILFINRCILKLKKKLFKKHKQVEINKKITIEYAVNISNSWLNLNNNHNPEFLGNY